MLAASCYQLVDVVFFCFVFLLVGTLNPRGLGHGVSKPCATSALTEF